MTTEDIDRPIWSLIVDDAQRITESCICTIDGITSIKPYREQDGSLWFTVWAGEQVVRRINGRFVVEVAYFTRSE